MFADSAQVLGQHIGDDSVGGVNQELLHSEVQGVVDEQVLVGSLGESLAWVQVGRDRLGFGVVSPSLFD